MKSLLLALFIGTSAYAGNNPYVGSMDACHLSMRAAFMQSDALNTLYKRDMKRNMSNRILHAYEIMYMGLSTEWIQAYDDCKKSHPRLADKSMELGTKAAMIAGILAVKQMKQQ
jgi:hypothetical protein